MEPEYIGRDETEPQEEIGYDEYRQWLEATFGTDADLFDADAEIR
jgi:hypothetical protein